MSEAGARSGHPEHSEGSGVEVDTLTEEQVKSQVERFESVVSDLLRPDGDRTEEFLHKLEDAPSGPVRLNNPVGIASVIDQDYHQAPAGAFPGSGFFPGDQFFAPLLGDKEVGRELTQHLADCVNRLREGRSDLVQRYARLFS